MFGKTKDLRENNKNQWKCGEEKGTRVKDVLVTEEPGQTVMWWLKSWCGNKGLNELWKLYCNTKGQGRGGAKTTAECGINLEKNICRLNHIYKIIVSWWYLGVGGGEVKCSHHWHIIDIVTQLGLKPNIPLRKWTPHMNDLTIDIIIEKSLEIDTKKEYYWQYLHYQIYPMIHNFNHCVKMFEKKYYR